MAIGAASNIWIALWFATEPRYKNGTVAPDTTDGRLTTATIYPDVPGFGRFGTPQLVEAP